MYAVTLSSGYRRALKRVMRHKDSDYRKLEAVISILESGERLDSKYLDHQLKGNLNDFRECHVQNDILLTYQKKEEVLVLLLIDIGTHSSTF